MRTTIPLNFFVTFSLICSFICSADIPDKSKLLSKWEIQQGLSEDLKSFNKINENIYFVAFETIPFKGNVELIHIGIDELNYDKTIPVSHTGTIELKLPQELVKLKDDYSYSFHRWHRNIYFYYNSETKKWISEKEYEQLYTEEYQASSPTSLTEFVTQYTGEVVVVLIAIFLVIFVFLLTLLWQIKRQLLHSKGQL